MERRTELEIDRNENLVNEYKGTLFEYLVASKLSKNFSLESSFVESLTDDLKEMLYFYERSIRAVDSELVDALPFLAQKVVESIEKNIKQIKKIKKIYWVGKSKVGLNLEANGLLNEKMINLAEADLLIDVDTDIDTDIDTDSDTSRDSNFGLIPISIKLSKANSFVNTKNGGVQSFISKYFAYERAPFFQSVLNSKIEECYNNLGEGLYSLANLKFNGEFDRRWIECGYSELPGELPANMRILVLEYYSQIISLIFQNCLYFYNEDRMLFFRSLYPLLGLGNNSITQIICFHGKDSVSKKRYALKGLHLISYNELLKQHDKIIIGEHKKGQSSFEIIHPDFTLQIRVKPMNKFTARAAKVNCSVKYKS
ncbi:MAG: hypothetical protein HQK49_20940 [Oligoflexia bacterium]|nr:hypothetical protein [Oligoflexia bacterium]